MGIGEYGDGNRLQKEKQKWQELNNALDMSNEQIARDKKQYEENTHLEEQEMNEHEDNKDEETEMQEDE